MKLRTSRREWLAAAGALVVGRSTLAGAQSPAVAFRGATAGEERDIDDLRFCWCPPGTFLMGSPPDEVGRRGDETRVSVTLTRGFWMAKFEATQGQWSRIAGAFPDRPPSAEFGIGADVPVYWVNYIEAERFAAMLTDRARRSGRLPAPWAVRLPTEAQWEYACRAGTTTATAFGPTLDRADANFQPGAPDSGGDRTAAGRAERVGARRANAWGLADMHGNVFEWCRDWYHASVPGGVDPDLSEVLGEMNRDGTYSRCRRGGAWNDPAHFCRSALRLRYEPERRSDHIGFRVAIVEAT